MFLKYFYDSALAHASYLVGCQRTGEAVVIDPSRHVQPYLVAAKAEGMRVTAAAETHIHADFVSGSKELADRAGAKLYLSDEGDSEWKYQFADQVDCQLLKNGDCFNIGNIRFQVMHTPGHTPESICFVLTDVGGGATQPMGIFTGDFVFVGSIGRPDLLETAAGSVGSAELGARQLFRSIELFRNLPDHLQVWPGHGAGSACGKGLGAIPTTTVGYEKRFNPALRFSDEQEFVDYILSDQPETPFYFAVMKKVNKIGPTLIRKLPTVELMPVGSLASAQQSGLVIDTRPSTEYSKKHIAGTVNIPSDLLERWAGFFVDYSAPVFLLTNPESLEKNLISLRAIGIDEVHGIFDVNSQEMQASMSEGYPSSSPNDLWPKIQSGSVSLLDVRSKTEFDEGHIPGAEHRFLGMLQREITDIDRSKPVVVQCYVGGRSAIAASILQRAGIDVVNMSGGIHRWIEAGLPTQTTTGELSEVQEAN
jgi:hydroxyacylglutathione hydrolase